MAPRSLERRFALLLVALATVLATTGCARALETGLGLLGVEREHQTSEPQAPDADSNVPVSRPDATQSVYEAMPPTNWRRYGLADPANFAYATSRAWASQPCVGVRRGLTRVLPGEGATPEPIKRLPPLAVAGEAVTGGWVLFDYGAIGLARYSMLRTARVGTYGEGCHQSIFLHVRLYAGRFGPATVR